MRSRSFPTDRLRPGHMAHLAFFHEFSRDELQRLAAAGGVRTYAQGELLATEGTRKQRRILYVVLQGMLQYVKRVRGERTRVVLTLRPGNVGGFLTFFNDDPSPVSVRSAGRSQVFEIGRREFQTLAAEQPGLAVKVLTILVRETVLHLDAFVGQVAASLAWALDLEHHVRNLPLSREE